MNTMPEDVVNVSLTWVKLPEQGYVVVVHFSASCFDW